MRNTEDRPSGGATHYYQLPKDATELHELINYKSMTHSIGEAFSALYRLNDNGEKVRNLEKVIFYAQLELQRTLEEQRLNTVQPSDDEFDREFQRMMDKEQ